MTPMVSEHLFDMTIHVPAEQTEDVGETPWGMRRIVKITGGEFEGPRLKGRIVGGDDWLL
jgi:hypothetical protein